MTITKRTRAVGLGLALATTAAGLSVGAGGSQAAAKHPSSVRATGLYFADPGFSILTDGKGNRSFHLYATGTGFRAATSSSGKAGTFAKNGPAMPKAPGWVVRTGDRGLWAPSVFQVNRKGQSPLYVMYFVGRDGRRGSPTKGKNCIGVATSTKRVNDFVPTSQSAPFLCPRKGMNEAIDPSMFQDRDGKRYMIYKVGNYDTRRFEIRANPMNATGTRDAGASFLLTDAAHHDFRGSSRAVIEAPQVIRRGNTLWLFTSRGGYRDCEYSTFAYRSTSIRSGKWNYASALLTPSNSGFCGPGGAEVVNDRGTFRIAFHVWKGGVPASRSTNAVRTTWIGTLGWNAKGNPYVR